MTTCCWRTVRASRGRPCGEPVAAGTAATGSPHGRPRLARAVNQWLRELPASGAHSPGTWESYARTVREWAEFLAAHGVGLFDSHERLKAGLSRYAEHRAAGPAEARFAPTTWGRHMSILSSFYRWAIAEGHEIGRAS